MKYLKLGLGLISTAIAIISISEIIEYIWYPKEFMIGSESMVGNGGMYYKSEFTFLLVNIIQIALFVSFIITGLSIKRKPGLLMMVLSVIFQLLILIII